MKNQNKMHYEKEPLTEYSTLRVIVLKGKLICPQVVVKWDLSQIPTGKEHPSFRIMILYLYLIVSSSSTDTLHLLLLSCFSCVSL